MFTDKMITFMSQHWWGNINKARKCVCLICHTCPKYNLGKLVFYLASRSFEPPDGPFEFLQMDFIQLPPSHGYKYI